VKHAATSIPEDRELTSEEQALVRWLLEHGEQHAPTFLSQLGSARVIARCSCGCASIDFSIAGRPPAREGGMNILSDYSWRDGTGHLFGAFVFACDGRLAGLDLWSIDGQATATQLPEPSELTPLEITRSA
jgi:hypothetical protein